MRKTILTPDSRLSEIKAILEKYRLKYGQWNKNVADAFRNKYCCNLSERDWGKSNGLSYICYVCKTTAHFLTCPICTRLHIMIKSKRRNYYVKKKEIRTRI